MSLHVRYFCAACCFGLWLGGLTFYAGVVVPLGGRLFGGVEQGFLTQQVAVWLNVLGFLAGSIAMMEASLRNQRLLFASALAMLGLQGALWHWHGRLSALLDASARTVRPQGDFYFEHRVYLLLVAAQWTCGVIAAWCLTTPSANRERQRPGA